MFGNIWDRVSIKWECAVEWYLLKVDTAHSSRLKNSELLRTSYNNFREKIVQEHISRNKFLNHVLFSQDSSKTLLQLTMLGIIISFTILLLSCQTIQRPQGENPNAALVSPGVTPPQALDTPAAKRWDNGGSKRELERLYLKKDELVIQETETGSSTGSIWADSREPRSLLFEATPNKEGQTITIMIPEELQFDPRNQSTQASRDKNAKQAGKDDRGNARGDTDSKKANADSPQNQGLNLSDPYESSPSLQIAQRPIKTFKMQIVGFEPSGDVFLRGMRKYAGENGEEQTTMVLAKVPRRALNGFELDARELTDVVINEGLGNRSREYSASGWDDMVSRRLSGFMPDINSEMSSLDSLREEIKTAQTALREQSKANEMERERMRKERDRMAAQSAASQSDAKSTSSEEKQSSAAKKTDSSGNDSSPNSSARSNTERKEKE